MTSLGLRGPECWELMRFPLVQGFFLRLYILLYYSVKFFFFLFKHIMYFKYNYLQRIVIELFTRFVSRQIFTPILNNYCAFFFDIAIKMYTCIYFIVISNSIIAEEKKKIRKSNLLKIHRDNR